MALESANTIWGLNPANPPGTDTRPEGDDHLRLIKSALQGTFLEPDTLANRPSAGTANRFYVATDELKIYYDNGVSWKELPPVPSATSVINKSGDYTVVEDDLPSGTAQLVGDISSASMSFTLPAPATIAGMNIVCSVGADDATDVSSKKLELFESGGTTQLWEGVRVGDYVRVTTNAAGTAYVVLDHYESHMAKVGLPSTEAVAAGASEKITSWSEDIDYGGVWDGTTNNEAVAPFDAWVEVSYVIAQNAIINELSAEAKINGTYVAQAQGAGSASGGDERGNPTLTQTYKITSGQDLELWAFNHDDLAGASLDGAAALDRSQATIRFRRRY